MAMNELLNEHFNVFIDKRINQVDSALEDNALYQEQQNILYDTEHISDSALDLCEKLQSIKAEQAYKQGFFDGLSLMACSGA